MRWSPGSLATRLWQPTGPAIEWSNPLSKGLALLLPMAQGDHGRRDLVSGAATTRTGTLAQTPSRAGGSFPLFGSGNYIDFAQPAGITHTTPCVIFWTQEPRGTSAYHAVLHWKATGATNPYLIYQAAADSGYYFVVGKGLSASGAHQVTFSAAAGATTNNRVDHYALLLPGGMDSVTGVRLWRNGVELAAGTSGTTNNFATNTSTVARIGALASAADPFEGLLGDFGVIARALSPQEMASLSANPSQIYAQEWRPRWAPALAGGGVSLVIQDGTHSHAADNLGLTSSLALVVADAAHAHVADGVTLTTASTLVVGDALHGHVAENLTLQADGSTSLSVADAFHAHAAEALSLSTASWLTVADAAHAHSADSITLSIGGGASDTPAWRRLVIRAEDRTRAIPAESRRLTVPAS